MPYEIRATRAVQRDLKRLPPALREEIQSTHFPKLKENPFQGYALRGDLRGLRSYHLTYRGTAYRIVYEVLTEQRVVLILMVGKREGFYPALRRRVLGKPGRKS